MISLVRVDNRLIHGQVVSTWIPQLRVDEVVVVDDEAADSPLMRAAMTLALPPRVTTAIHRFDEVDWKGLSEGPRKVLVLVRGVAEAMDVVESGADVRHLNLGNVHFADGRKPVSPSVFLSKEELEILERIAAKGIEVEARAVPSDHRTTLVELGSRLAAAT